MLLVRYGPEGFHAAGESMSALRILYSDPLTTPVSAWDFGRPIDLATEGIRPPVVPGKLVGIGRNYREHARELDNPVPAEPVNPVTNASRSAQAGRYSLAYSSECGTSSASMRALAISSRSRTMRSALPPPPWAGS